MARGKEAAAAANRRYEAALQVIDRLNTQNSELKIRTKAVEAAAQTVPTLKKRIAELEASVAAGITPKWEAERERHAAQIAGMDSDQELLKSMVERLIKHNAHITGMLIPKEIVDNRARLGLVLELPGTGREERRTQVFNSTGLDRGETKPQDNFRSADENRQANVAPPALAPYLDRANS